MTSSDLAAIHPWWLSSPSILSPSLGLVDLQPDRVGAVQRHLQVCDMSAAEVDVSDSPYPTRQRDRDIGVPRRHVNGLLA